MTVNSALTNALCEATSWQRTFGGEPAHPQKISPSLRCVWCSSLTPFASCWSTWRLAAGRPDVAASVEGSLVQTICAQRPQSLAAVFQVVLRVEQGRAAAAASNSVRPHGWQVPRQQVCIALVWVDAPVVSSAPAQRTHALQAAASGLRTCAWLMLYNAWLQGALKVPYNADGPFWVLRDGNCFMAPFQCHSKQT